jgi:hypothetical protein
LRRNLGRAPGKGRHPEPGRLAEFRVVRQTTPSGKVLSYRAPAAVSGRGASRRSQALSMGYLQNCPQRESPSNTRRPSPGASRARCRVRRAANLGREQRKTATRLPAACAGGEPIPVREAASVDDGAGPGYRRRVFKGARRLAGRASSRAAGSGAEPCQKRLRGDSSDSIAERRWPSFSLLMRYCGSSPTGGMSCAIWYAPVGRSMEPERCGL